MAAAVVISQGGAHGFVIVGEADDGPASIAANGNGNGGGIGDDDLPPDFDSMPMEAFETKPPAAVAVEIETMEVD